jgi:Holin of 3TMs, for gene-transfer release
MPLEALFGKLLGVNDIGDMFSKIVGTFKLSPDKAAEMQTLKETHAADLAKLQLQMEAQAQDAVTREVEAASANIRAEATNGDKFTSRARPLFLYVCNVILVWNYIVVPMRGMVPIAFPDPLFWLFGSVMLGYVGARSWEKISAIKGAA